jgi:ketosteroid isomerase-like protein
VVNPASTVRSHEGQVVSAAQSPECVRAYFDAINAEDFERLADVWTPTAELRAVGARPRHGREEITAYFRGAFSPWASHLDRPTRVILAEDVVVTEIEFKGVTHDGKELVFDALDVFDLTDGLIARLTTWYDLAWVRSQL